MRSGGLLALASPPVDAVLGGRLVLVRMAASVRWPGSRWSYESCLMAHVGHAERGLYCLANPAPAIAAKSHID